MGALDLNRVAITMGKMLKLLPALEDKGLDFFSIDDNKEEFFTLAYMARVGILDRIEANTYMRNGRLPITIPLGIFKSRKETMETALDLTIGKLLELTEGHNWVNSIVTNILERGKSFYEFEALLPPEVRSKL